MTEMEVIQVTSFTEYQWFTDYLGKRLPDSLDYFGGAACLRARRKISRKLDTSLTLCCKLRHNMHVLHLH